MLYVWLGWMKLLNQILNIYINFWLVKKTPSKTMYIQWYYLSEGLAFRNKWFSDVKTLTCNIEFFKWLEYSLKLDDQKESLNILLLINGILLKIIK